ncbi:hypothetical protein BH10BDE1_BH10BDE1_30510 [soil metagenome]
MAIRMAASALRPLFGVLLGAVIFAFGFVGSFDFALAETSGSVQDLIICKSPGKLADAVVGKSVTAGRSVRTLRVYETREKSESGESTEGCRATYSKTGVEQTVGTSRQLQHCQSILSGIQKNLEASKWSCRHVGMVAVLKTNAAESSEAMAKKPVESRSDIQPDTVSVVQ